MSHKLDIVETWPQDLKLVTPTRISHSFLLADSSALEPIEVELVDYLTSASEPDLKALVADSQCEV